VLASENSKDLSVLRELIEAEQIKPTIDRTFTLNETPSAIRYLLEGRARGKIVVVV
jgi:NADPH:quinone reductase-like Zn-dependent oxidoreductase